MSNEKEAIKAKMGVVFNTPEGREVLAYLAKICYLDKSIYNYGEESSAAIHRDGARMVILKIMKTLDLSIEDLLKK